MFFLENWMFKSQEEMGYWGRKLKYAIKSRRGGRFVTVLTRFVHELDLESWNTLFECH